MTTIGIASAIFGGAVVVRVTGLGFALVASPLLVLILGPFEGVLLCNLLSVIVSAGMLVTHWRRVEWRRAALLLLPAPVVIPAGALLVHRLPTSILSVVIGVLLLTAVALVARGRPFRLLAGRSGALVAGAASSGLNVLAGVGGPALALYGTSQRWAIEGFRATVSVCSIVMNTLSLATKGFPEISGSSVGIVIGALVAGTVVGEVVARRVSGRHGQRILLALSALGALAAIVKGLVG